MAGTGTGGGTGGALGNCGPGLERDGALIPAAQHDLECLERRGDAAIAADLDQQVRALERAAVPDPHGRERHVLHGMVAIGIARHALAGRGFRPEARILKATLGPDAGMVGAGTQAFALAEAAGSKWLG